MFAFNFHPTQSRPDLRIPVPDPADYRLVLDTDEGRFEGFDRVERGITYPRQDVGFGGRRQSLSIYLPNRSAQVLAPVV